MPLKHESGGVQTLPQAPQFCGSVSRMAHLLPHLIVKGAQSHTPPTQTWPRLQALPHAPQF